MEKYDLIIIGSGPAGEKAAVKAANLQKKVALIEKSTNVGGAGVNTGTLPSKALKQTAVFLSGRYDKGLYGIEKKLEREASIKEFLFRKNDIVEKQRQIVLNNLPKIGVELFHGTASFIDAKTLHVAGDKERQLSADKILIATGSYPAHPNHIPFDQKRVHDSDSILNIDRFPTSICILGAGVIGCEYATIFATMGIKTYLINNDRKILPFLDTDISQELLREMQKNNITIFFENSVTKIHNKKDSLILELEKEGPLKCDMFLFAAGRNGCIKDLALDGIGLNTGKRETILVNECYQTNIPHIFAVGDVIGFPALASTGMDQGRVAVTHMFDLADSEHIHPVLPFGIYTIPEVSMVGMTSEQAAQEDEAYISGIARCPECVRGQLLGNSYGQLKIIAHKKSGIISGVHMIGPLATEIIHYGMSLVCQKTSVIEVLGHVFNFPTLHGLYKNACYDLLYKEKIIDSEE